jgi:hypothetical protein
MVSQVSVMGNSGMESGNLKIVGRRIVWEFDFDFRQLTRRFAIRQKAYCASLLDRLMRG